MADTAPNHAPVICIVGDVSVRHKARIYTSEEIPVIFAAQTLRERVPIPEVAIRAGGHVRHARLREIRYKRKCPACVKHHDGITRRKILAPDPVEGARLAADTSPERTPEIWPNDSNTHYVDLELVRSTAAHPSCAPTQTILPTALLQNSRSPQTRIWEIQTNIAPMNRSTSVVVDSVRHAYRMPNLGNTAGVQYSVTILTGQMLPIDSLESARLPCDTCPAP